MAMILRSSVLLVVLAWLCGGCQRTAPLDTSVEAGSSLSFSMWRNRVGSDLTAEEWEDFDEAVREIKYRITSSYEDTGELGVDQAMRAKVNGQSIRSVLRLGWNAKLRRLQSERAEWERILKVNATLRTRPGDVASIDYLRQLRDRQEARLRLVSAEIQTVRGKLGRASGWARRQP